MVKIPLVGLHAMFIAGELLSSKRARNVMCLAIIEKPVNFPRKHFGLIHSTWFLIVKGREASGSNEETEINHDMPEWLRILSICRILKIGIQCSGMQFADESRPEVSEMEPTDIKENILGNNAT